MSRKRQADLHASDDDDSDSLSGSEDSISSDSNIDSDEEVSSDEEELVNCDFEFFDPQKQDYLGIKHLLRQLFDTDADLFDLGELTEIILAQPLLGSTVKTEGHEGDPLSFLTVLNLRTHQDKPVIKALMEYILAKTKSNSNFQKRISEVLEDKSSDIGLVLSDRIINMPPAIAPPSYKMLLEEMQWANEDKEPYNFGHFLIFSRTYTQLDTEEEEEIVKPRPKKLKRRGSIIEVEKDYFHPEDQLFANAGEVHSFNFINQVSAQDQGLRTSGLLILVQRAEFENAIGEMEAYLAQGS